MLIIMLNPEYRHILGVCLSLYAYVAECAWKIRGYKTPQQVVHFRKFLRT